MNIQEIELFPGMKELARPLFTPREYEEFRERWHHEVVPIMHEHARRRALSAHEARFHFVK